MSYAAIIAKAIRDAGGPARVARQFGYPINRYVVSVWQRNAHIPDDYRDEVAKLAGMEPADLRPPVSESRKPKFNGEAKLYRAMIQTLDLNPKSAARLHNVDHAVVLSWMAGYVMVPVNAFDDLHFYAGGRNRQTKGLTVDKAMAITKLNQRGLAQLTGIDPAIVTRWRRRGVIPERYARIIVRKDHTGDAPLRDEDDEN